MEHKSQDWHRADIKSALEKRGITLRELSRSAGLSPDSLRNVFTRSWPRAELIIAQALETTPDVIWPSRYLSKSEKQPHKLIKIHSTN
ncbi:helix-turn-helix domain-containing protein [Citrobacter freundii]|uniref:helix-turn-helix domain-containing protein n=1 Tax=Citrobacter freundii TaxID=546 RepID=UPI000FDBB32A|nr:helix-turn-helix domain-containing protein [Citrobacter freundii]RVR95893.1 transcriptional regulator [Citrobacter freundii]